MRNITIDADNLLIIISFGLLIAIFFNLLFGCSYKKPREYFNNKDESKTETDGEKKEVKQEDKPKDTTTGGENAKQEPPVQLSKFEQEIKEGLENGNISTDDVMKLIEKEKFTLKNVENLSKFINQNLDEKNKP